MQRIAFHRVSRGLPLLAALLCGAQVWASGFNPDHYQPLTSDRRALRVGDVVTVIVLESNRASSRASTESASDTGISVQASDRGNGYSGGAALRGDSNGRGGTSRAGDVRAQLAVRVTGEERDGLLRVSGQQVLLVNGEAQTIELSGLVRRDDVGADNTLLSSRIADARIAFSGHGVVSEAQKQNLMYRILRWLRLV